MCIRDSVKHHVLNHATGFLGANIWEFVKGFVSSWIEGIVSLFVGVFKQILKVIKEGIKIFVQSAKVLFGEDSKEMTPAQKGDAIIKIIGGSVDVYKRQDYGFLSIVIPLWACNIIMIVLIILATAYIAIMYNYSRQKCKAYMADKMCIRDRAQTYEFQFLSPAGNRLSFPEPGRLGLALSLIHISFRQRYIPYGYFRHAFLQDY